MKDVFVGILLVILAIVVLVSGYYIGIFVAILGFIAMVLSIVLGGVFFVILVIQDLWQEAQRKRSKRRSEDLRLPPRVP